MVANGCGGPKKNTREIINPGAKTTLDNRSPFLKIHLRNGRAYILSEWTVTDKKILTGKGQLFDINRIPVANGTFTISSDSVVIFETNILEPSQAVGGLTILTGVSVVVTTLCIANPKACFGSCPTFYITDGKEPILQAEGFSASIAPALEATDIDALYRATSTESDVHVTVKNEALETHVIRFAKLLAVPRTENTRVFVTPANEFYSCGMFISPSSAMSSEGDCLESIRYFDGVERFSLADSSNLASKEIIELKFDDVPDGDLGLVIASRQTLLTTFLFYQTLAYMGSSAGDWLALLERQPLSIIDNAKSVGKVLGDIEFYVMNESSEWTLAASFSETGPLATDVRMLPMPASFHSSRKIQIRLNKGLWRLDHIALVPIQKKVNPIQLDPYLVIRDEEENAEAKDALIDSARTLITYPGDSYRLSYRLPDRADKYELFMKSRGYYLEWIREEWIKEEDPNKAAMMFFDPKGSLKELAPVFKKMEAQMEKQFWNSKYVRP